MTSAVPYEPDDFDNNPFAESSVIIQPEPVAVQSEDEPEQGDDGGEEVAHQNGDEPAAAGGAAGLPPQTDSTSQDVNSPFHKYPTDADLKRYLPERLNRNAFELTIRVMEIEKNGSGMAKNPVVKLDAQIKNIPGFRKSVYKDVRRTFKELESLYTYLIYNNIEVFVPALPNIPGLYNPGSPEFVASLSRSIQDWFTRVCGNPILIRNQEFVLFLEQNDFSYTPSKTKPSSQSVMATGLKRKTLKQFQPPYDASQELAAYRPMTKSVYVQAQKLLEKLDKLVRLQKQSSSANMEFYSKMAELSALEESQEMGKIWVRFNKILQLFNEMDLVGGISLSSHLAETFQLVSDDCFNIKESLTNRHLLMRELISAEENAKKRHMAIARLKTKSIIDPIKVDEAIRALELASNYEKELKYQVKRTTYEMLIEAQDYLGYLTSLVTKAFKLIAQQQIQQERKKLHLLSSNKLIHPHESLSRLGREALPLGGGHGGEHGEGGVVNSDSWNSRPKKKFETGEDVGSVNEEIAGVDAKSAASLLAGSSF